MSRPIALHPDVFELCAHGLCDEWATHATSAGRLCGSHAVTDHDYTARDDRPASRIRIDRAALVDALTHASTP